MSALRKTLLKRSWQAEDACSSSVELTRHTGTVVEYQLYDSSGAQHCAEAYFDSLFNGLLFRDCTPLCDRPGALCVSDILRRTEQWWFDLVREADAIGRGRNP